jgi:glycosyltransferase involved in cell wall biosynthesis
MQSLAVEYDFFINTSTFDAQATTILEAMSWGFVVACTPETGYTEEGIFQLSTTDVKRNVAVMERLQKAEEEELIGIADQYRVLLAEKFTWSRFTGMLSQIIKRSKAAEKRLSLTATLAGK